MNAKDIPIPEKWPHLIRQAMLHSISLAHVGIIVSWSRSADSAIQNVRLKSKLDKLQTEAARAKNQLRIISSRFSRVPAKNRPNIRIIHGRSISQLFRPQAGSGHHCCPIRSLSAGLSATGWLSLWITFPENQWGSLYSENSRLPEM